MPARLIVIVFCGLSLCSSIGCCCLGGYGGYGGMNRCQPCGPCNSGCNSGGCSPGYYPPAGYDPAQSAWIGGPILGATSPTPMAPMTAAGPAPMMAGPAPMMAGPVPMASLPTF